MKLVNELCINLLGVLGLLTTLSGCGNQKDTIQSNIDIADSYWDIYSDTWVATDALGRTMPSQEEVGNVKDDKRRVVGMFYITWHSDNLANLKSPYRADVSKVLEEAPEARLDANHPSMQIGRAHV